MLSAISVKRKEQKERCLLVLRETRRVEPVGTVTMYLEFVDKETKDTLLPILSEAYDLHDFAHLLCNRVCEGETTNQLIFMAVHFAALFFDFTALDRIAKAHGRLSIIRPNLFYGTALQGKPEDFEKVRSAADEVLASKPPDWLAMEMHLVKLEAENEEYPKVLHDSSTLDTIEGILEKQTEFDFYRSRVLDSLTIRAIRDGDAERGLELNQSAIDNAEKHDDINRLAHLLRTRAGILESSDHAETQRLLLRSRDLMKRLGDRGGFADVLFLLSKAESIRGNYNAAIDYNLESVSIWESIGMPVGMFALNLSTLYNLTGDSEAGFEWAKMAENELSSKPMWQPRAILNEAWSLTLQKKYSEASSIIDGIRESINRSGLESNLGWLYFVVSVLDAAEEDFFSAATNVEESLEIYERHSGYVSFYICLQHRAKIEVYETILTQSHDTDKAIGPWLQSLEEKARSEDLPGILAQALLLKATLFDRIENRIEAKRVIKELAFLVNSNGLEFLRVALNRLSGSID